MVADGERGGRQNEIAVGPPVVRRSRKDKEVEGAPGIESRLSC